MDKRVVVLGGGIAGLSAAIVLAENGIEVKIIEKRPFLGGFSATFTCKATDRCQQCGACRVEETLNKAISLPNIYFYMDSELIRVEKKERFKLKIAPSSPSPNHIKAFSRFNSQENIKGKHGVNEELEADSIIISTGFSPFDPRKRPTYGYGQWKDVITALEMEQMLREKGIPIRPSNGHKAKKIAFVQCVGSRNAQFNALWCSEVCCPYALRMGTMIKYREPESDVWIFFIDLQNVGKEGFDFLQEANQSLRLLNIVPVDIFEDRDRKVVIAFEEENTRKRESFDLVVLSVGIAPNEDNTRLAKLFGINAEDTGFLEEKDKSVPCATSIDGIFLAGTVTGPKGILDTISHARGAAFETLTYLGGV